MLNLSHIKDLFLHSLEKTSLCGMRILVNDISGNRKIFVVVFVTVVLVKV